MKNFNEKVWEKEIYQQGHQLNLYPFDNVVSFVFRNYPRDKPRGEIKILEVGCGTGNNLWFAAREGFHTTGIDGSESAINIAKHRFENDGLNGNFILGDFSQLPFDDDSFDLAIDRGAIVCCNFIVGKQSIKEINRVLKPAGLFFFNPYSQVHSSFASGKLQPDGSTTNITEGTLKGIGDLSFYSYRDILEILGAGWEVETIHHKESREISHANQSSHAEWEVVAKKVKK